MTTLSQQEREDLRSVFASISERKPVAFPKIEKLKKLICSINILGRFSPAKKWTSYHK